MVKRKQAFKAKLGASNLTSERSLVFGSGTLWALVSPLERAYARAIAGIQHRYASEIPSRCAPERRSLVSELGFEGASGASKNGMRGIKIDPEIVDRVCKYIGRLEGRNDVSRPSEVELAEAVEIGENICKRFRRGSITEVAVFRPTIRGCGPVSSCEADVVAGNRLIEIKAVNRNFNSSDLRQVLVYLCLNHSSSQFDISEIELLNPRLGVYYRTPVRAFCEQISGEPPLSLYGKMMDVLANEDLWPR